jgi:hypothetical protein
MEINKHQSSIPSEVLAITYGGIVRQMVADHENTGQVNEQLKKWYALQYCAVISLSDMRRFESVVTSGRGRHGVQPERFLRLS